jgi:hypothetical protein
MVRDTLNAFSYVGFLKLNRYGLGIDGIITEVDENDPRRDLFEALKMKSATKDSPFYICGPPEIFCSSICQAYVSLFTADSFQHACNGPPTLGCLIGE